MQHLFIIDPFEKLVQYHDSTIALMEAALIQQHNVFQCEMKDIFWHKNQVIAHGKSVSQQSDLLISSFEKTTLNLTENEALIVWMRKDPPVDEAYMRTCQILRLAKCKILNDPNTLMTCDEKLFALEFSDFMPQTYVTQDKEQILQLLKEQHKMIAKPIGGKGGEGIFLLSHDDKNTATILEMMTSYATKPIIIQEFLPAIKQGDKRIFLIAGEPLGGVMRVPKESDHRANMAAGGGIEKTLLTQKEREICRAIKPRLLELGMYIVGIDVIGDKLTEINITSPTCLKEIASLDGTHPAMEIIKWSEKL